MMDDRRETKDEKRETIDERRKTSQKIIFYVETSYMTSRYFKYL
jgi:hypothetical protein